ncbi:FMN-dependent NADH-azoreductase [Pseudoduganella sp. UC29_106]|uniref:FMN-dependent NADH-azoreductase n=1 Tax=Pseudoduganella sp. UC29_106 TaxID=3374553 RepID=UPI0037579A1D
MKVLHIDSSINGQQSVSRQLSAAIVRRLREANTGASVAYRDVVADPVPQSSGMAGSSPLLDEFLAADVVVIGAPMYNFGVPSQLKAWLDTLAVAGVTFSYGASGPQGLCGGKRIIVASSRGGIYSAPSPAAGMDHQESYLSSFFGFLGAQIEFIRAEGVGMGDEQRQRAMDSAFAAAGALQAA